MDDSLLLAAAFLPTKAKNTSVPNTTAVATIAVPFKIWNNTVFICFNFFVKQISHDKIFYSFTQVN